MLIVTLIIIIILIIIVLTSINKNGYGKKTCQPNGTWYSRYQPGQNGSQGNWVEWTDYTTCVDKQRLVTSVYLALGCNACSILFLLPALLIFILYRSLRQQHRIRLHINFFTALLFANITAIMWDVIVTHDRLTSDSINTTPVLLTNGAGCKLLAFLRLYFKSTTYVWMFCEGLYLHRLISNAFRPPKSLFWLYMSGWGVPLLYCVLYVILRGIYANDSCWAKSFGHLEWIIYCPNLLCLLVNLFFLCNILRVLLTQLQSHPNEPSNFRRALKATFVLIPLFGVQLFVTVYRLPAGQPGGAEYEQFTVFVTNSQGFFVALIFCFFNGEILRKVRKRHSRDEMNYYLSVRSMSNTRRQQNNNNNNNNSSYSSNKRHNKVVDHNSTKVLAQMKRTCSRLSPVWPPGTENTLIRVSTQASTLHPREELAPDVSGQQLLRRNGTHSSSRTRRKSSTSPAAAAESREDGDGRGVGVPANGRRAGGGEHYGGVGSAGGTTSAAACRKGCYSYIPMRTLSSTSGQNSPTSRLL